MDENESARGGFPLGRILLVALIGAILALALSESARSKLLDLMFGAEEEFDFGPIETAASDAEGAAAA